MRIFLASLALFFVSTAVFAQNAEVESQTRYMTGTGTHFGFCTGNDYFCIQNVKDTSRRYAVDDASWHCKMQNGIPDQFGVSCYDICNPSYLPPDSGSTSISCRSDCQVRCEIPDHNTEVVE